MTETMGPVATSEDYVRAERVEISQGSAGLIEATSVSLQQGGAGRVRATDMSVNQGGVGVARTDNLRLEAGAGAFAVVAKQAEVAEGARVFVLIARSAGGTLRPVLDWRAAAAFGAGLGLVLRLLRRG